MHVCENIFAECRQTLLFRGKPREGPVERDTEYSAITVKGEGKCCGRALKAAGGVEIVSVVRIREPKK